MRMLSTVVRKRPALATAVVAGVALVLFAPAAHALSYSTSGAPEKFSLGDTLGTASTYDQLIINGASGTLNPGTIVLNSLEFIAGVNAIVPQVYNNIFSFAETMTIGT